MSQTPSTHTSTPKFKLLHSIQLWWLSYRDWGKLLATCMASLCTGPPVVEITVCQVPCLPAGLNGLAKTAQETSYIRRRRYRGEVLQLAAKAGNWHFNRRQPVSSDSQSQAEVRPVIVWQNSRRYTNTFIAILQPGGWIGTIKNVIK